MKLSVPLIHQKTDKDCGLACVAMVLAYDGKECDYDAMEERYGTRNENSNGTSLFELGTYLLEKEYDVVIKTGNVILFNKNQYDMTEHALREHVTWLQKKRYPNQFRAGIEKLTTFMDNGGHIVTGIPLDWDLRETLKDGRPIIASVTNTFMRSDSVGYNKSFVTITGADYGGFYVNDPGETQNEIQRYASSDMMYAIHANTVGDVDNGAILIALPKPS